jgi:hypothetical protein
LVRRQGRLRVRRTLLVQFDFFVDNFVGQVQGSSHSRKRLRRVLFHSLDEVFRALNYTYSPQRQEPACGTSPTHNCLLTLISTTHVEKIQKAWSNCYY